MEVCKVVEEAATDKKKAAKVLADGDKARTKRKADVIVLSDSGDDAPEATPKGKKRAKTRT